MSIQFFEQIEEDNFKVHKLLELQCFTLDNLPRETLVLPVSTIKFFDNNELKFSAICPILFLRNRLYLIQEESTSIMKAQKYIDVRFSYFSHVNSGCLIEFAKGSKQALIEVQSLKIVSEIMQQIKTFTIQYGYTDKFQTLRTLGRGSFGDVFEVLDIDSQVLAASKRISKRSIHNEQTQTRKIAREITLNQDLSNTACIVNLQSIYEDEEYIYLVMEHLEGGTLYEFMTKSNRVSNEYELEKIMSQLLLSLDLLHRKGIVHRDIKPENILLVSNPSKSLEVKICDLGLSTTLKSAKKDTYLHGTLGFVAPEVFNGQGYSEKTDIFSLGCLFYELLTLTDIMEETELRPLFEVNQTFKLENYTEKFNILNQQERTLIEAMLGPSSKRPSASQLLQFDFFKKDKEAIGKCLNINKRLEKVFLGSMKEKNSNLSEFIIEELGINEKNQELDEGSMCLDYERPRKRANSEQKEEEEEKKDSIEESKSNKNQVESTNDSSKFGYYHILKRSSKESYVQQRIFKNLSSFKKPQEEKVLLNNSNKPKIVVVEMEDQAQLSNEEIDSDRVSSEIDQYFGIKSMDQYEFTQNIWDKGHRMNEINCAAAYDPDNLLTFRIQL